MLLYFFIRRSVSVRYLLPHAAGVSSRHAIDVQSHRIGAQVVVKGTRAMRISLESLLVALKARRTLEWLEPSRVSVERRDIVEQTSEQLIPRAIYLSESSCVGFAHDCASGCEVGTLQLHDEVFGRVEIDDSRVVRPELLGVGQPERV